MGQPESSSCIIRGGADGRARLRMLGRVIRPTTDALFRQVGIPRDAICFDVGCGGGHVTVELRRLAADGAATGVDLDEDQLDLARTEAVAAGFRDIEFRYEGVTQPARSRRSVTAWWKPDSPPNGSSTTRSSASRASARRGAPGRRRRS